MAAYAVGCVATGYYLTKLRIARDIRHIGSGSSGATNVGRVLGWQGFVVTLTVDAAKAALVVLLSQRRGLDPWTMWLAVLAVVAGHIWPVQLGFKGGKGVASYLGALVIVDWQAGVILAGLAGAAYLVARQPILAGLAGMTALPVVLWALGFPPPMVAGTLTLGALMLLTHRSNIRLGIEQMALDGRWGKE